MRRTARENAFKLIFERLINDSDDGLGYNELVSSLEKKDAEFFDEIVTKVAAEESFLRSVVARYLRGFDVCRIYKIDLAILYVAICEILFIDDVPPKVSVNEAVELAKVYSTDSAPSFVNGLLGSVISARDELIDERKRADEENGVENENCVDNFEEGETDERDDN